VLYFYLKIHQNAFGGRTPPGSAGELTALPQTPSWIKGEGREGRGRERERKGGGRKGEGPHNV